MQVLTVWHSYLSVYFCLEMCTASLSRQKLACVFTRAVKHCSYCNSSLFQTQLGQMLLVLRICILLVLERSLLLPLQNRDPLVFICEEHCWITVVLQRSSLSDSFGCTAALSNFSFQWLLTPIQVTPQFIWNKNFEIIWPSGAKLIR